MPLFNITGLHCSNCLEGRKCQYWKDILKELDKPTKGRSKFTTTTDPALMDRSLIRKQGDSHPLAYPDYTYSFIKREHKAAEED